jgi:hypothetical protein
VLTLRERLLAVRDGALKQIDESEVIDAGLLSLAANASVVLDVLDKPDAGCARRGGDYNSGERAERDEALRSLASLIVPEKPAEEQARILAGRLARYQPMANETTPERVLMQKIAHSDLPVPKVDRLARILRSSE